MYRLAYIVTHPIQYQAPLLRLLSETEGLELQVFFLSDFSVHPHHEPAFGCTFKFDVPLTEGYVSEVLPRWFIGLSTPLRPNWPVSGLKHRLAAGNFDAVWIHGWGHVGLRQALLAARSLKRPVLLRAETTLETSRSRGVKRWLRDRYCRHVVRSAAACLAIGSLNRRFYRAFGVPEHKLFDVPYAVDNASFQASCAAAALRRAEFRQELGLAPGRPVILFAAKFIPVKAAGDLIAAHARAFASLAPAGRPYLLLVGDGPLREKLTAQAGSAANAEVRFLGFRNQSELPALYDLCDVFVLPSHFEPWGLVINEVMNAAKPVIVSERVGCAPDLVRQGENGWLFPAGDIGRLAQALETACADPVRSEGMGRRSLEIISGWGFQQDRLGILSALEFVRRESSHAP